MRQAVLIRRDPLQRNFLLIVCNRRKGEKGIVAVIIPVDRLTLKGNHITGGAGNGFLNGNPAGTAGLFHITGGGKMRTAALKQAQLDPADLGAGMLLHNIGQQGSQAAELGVAEAVRRRGLGLRDEASVRIVNALGNRDKNLAVLLIDGVNIRKELVHVKIALRQIDQIRA